MAIIQLSVFVENKHGRLAAIADILAKNNINIRALSIADTTDFGILRIIVDDTEKAISTLVEAGITVRRTEVIGVVIDDVPGGLSKILTTISNSGVVIEYMYAFVGKTHEKAITIIRTSDVDTALKALAENNIHVVSDEEIKNI